MFSGYEEGLPLLRYYGPPTRHCNVSEVALYASAADTAALRGRIARPSGVAEGRGVNQFGNVFGHSAYVGYRTYGAYPGKGYPSSCGCEKEIL